MSVGRWRWLLLDVVLATGACVAAVGLVREVVEGRPLPRAHVSEAEKTNTRPAVPDPAEAPAQVSADPAGGAPEEYGVIAARNLFAAARGEVAVVAPTLPGIKPVLHGVVIDGERSRAYLDDPVAQRIFGYSVGDAVAGGRLERILADRVMIRGPAGVAEVLVHDPTKPQDEVPTPAAPTRARRAGGRSAPEAPSEEPTTAAAPGKTSP
jgi:hypothetical protein